MATVLDYSKKSFSEIQVELYQFIEKYYPDSLQDFGDATVGSLLLDLCAAVGENLNFNTDRAFQETQIDNAQQRKSLINLARTVGVKIPNVAASVTIVDFSITVPVKGDTFDSDYLPILKRSAQIQGAGKTFETIDDIDFSKTTNSYGSANRIIVPNLDANSIIQSYNIIKKEIVFAGKTKTYKYVVRTQDSIPFLKIQLPEQDVILIDDVILLNGINFNSSPTNEQFRNPEILNGEKFYEVDALAQKNIFLKKYLSGDTNSLVSGYWSAVKNRFIKEFTDNGFCQITFGGGNGDYVALESAMSSGDVSSDLFLANFYKTSALGLIPKPNSTLFFKYKTGGGTASNIGANVLNSMGSYEMSVNGSNSRLNSSVYSSLRVTNKIPSFGGKDKLSTDELRNYIKYSSGSHNRSVILNDYISKIYDMDGVFGRPFRVSAAKENNKVIIGVLGIDSVGKLTNTNTSTLKDNIARYLTEFRNINDYVEVRDGKIFNIGCEIKLLVENGNKLQIASNAINTIASFFDIKKSNMNTDVYIGLLIKELSNTTGIINIIDYKFYNKVGGQYSNNPIEMDYVDSTTREIKLVNNTLYSTEDSMYEIKYPEKDIKVILNFIG